MEQNVYIVVGQISLNINIWQKPNQKQMLEFEAELHLVKNFDQGE